VFTPGKKCFRKLEMRLKELVDALSSAHPKVKKERKKVLNKRPVMPVIVHLIQENAALKPLESI